MVSILDDGAWCVSQCVCVCAVCCELQCYYSFPPFPGIEYTHDDLRENYVSQINISLELKLSLRPPRILKPAMTSTTMTQTPSLATSGPTRTSTARAVRARLLPIGTGGVASEQLMVAGLEVSTACLLPNYISLWLHILLFPSNQHSSQVTYACTCAYLVYSEQHVS